MEGQTFMNNKEKITSKQLMAIMISNLIGIGVLTLPRMVTEAVGPDGWLLVLVGGVLVIIMSIILVKLGLMFPEKTAVEYAVDVIGKPLGILFSLGLFLHFATSCVFQSRVLAEVTKQFLLDRTPTEVLVITILLACSYIVRKDIATIGRVGEMLVPVFFIPSFLFLLPGIPKMDFTNLLPVFGTSPMKFLTGMGSIVTSYLGFETLILFQPMMNRPRDAGRAMITALSIVTLLYTLVVIVAVALFGVVEIQNLVWPSFSVYRVIEIPGALIENVHGVMMAIWVIAVYTTMAIFFFAAVTVLSRLLSFKDHSFMVLPLAFLIYFLALIPNNISQVYTSLDMISIYLGIPFGFVLPFIFYIIARIRGIGEQGGEKDDKIPEKDS